MYSRRTGMPTLGRETEAQRRLCSQALSQGSERQKRGRVPNSSFTVCKSVSNRPLWGRRGLFGNLLQQLEFGIFGRTAVCFI